MGLNSGVSGTTSGVATPIMVGGHPATGSVPVGSVATPTMVGAPFLTWPGAMVLTATATKPFVLLYSLPQIG